MAKQIKGTDMVVKQIPTASIIWQGEPNARTDYRQVPKLTEDIRKNGLLQPPVGCQNPDGSVTLYCGFCRVMACVELGWETIPINIVPAMSDKDRAILNARENLSRDNLTPYDKAKFLVGLQEFHQMTAKEIAMSLSGDLTMNAKHVHALTSCVRNLDGKILMAWEQGHPLASTMRLTSLQAMDKDEQLKTWQELLTMEAGLVKEGLDSDKVQAALADPYDVDAYERMIAGRMGRGKKGVSAKIEGGKVVNPKARKPDKDTLDTVLSWLAEGLDGVDPRSGKIAADVIEWCDGRESCLVISGAMVYDPDAEKSKKAQAKVQSKADKQIAELLAKVAALEAEKAKK